MANPNWTKGVSGNPNGRKPGIPNKSTEKFRNAIADLLNNMGPKVEGWLDEIAAEDKLAAIDALAKLAEYGAPKLARTEIKADVSIGHEDALKDLE